MLSEENLLVTQRKQLPEKGSRFLKFHYSGIGSPCFSPAPSTTAAWTPSRPKDASSRQDYFTAILQSCSWMNKSIFPFSSRIIKPKYTKTEDITVTKTDPSLLIFGGGNFQMKWAKKWLSNTLTHSHHIFIKMLWPTKEQFSIQFILFCYCYNKVIKLWWKSVIPSDDFF